MTAILIVVLTAHLILCAVVIVLALLKLMKLRLPAILFMLLVLVFGPVCVIALDLHKKNGGETVDIEMHRFRVEQEIYRSLGFTAEEEPDVVSLEEAMILNNSGTRRSLMMDLIKENVVPLEEALSLSTGEVRRKLMMNILNSDTVALYDLLEQARLNDDVEVVHYATTAMSELNKQYDLMLEKYRVSHQNDPQDVKVLADYCDCMERFINLRMVRGQMLDIRRNQFIGLLKELIVLHPTEDNYLRLANQQMLAKNDAEADQTFAELMDHWPGSEKVWLLYIESFARKGDGEAVRKKVNQAMREHVYFSAKAREQLSFWMGGTSC